MSLLVVAGEPSGDRAAADVLTSLRTAGFSSSIVGFGGKAMTKRESHISNIADRATMGFSDLSTRLLSFGRSLFDVEETLRKKSVSTALLVHFTEFNKQVAALLKRRGVRVVWYIAPQVWAWRPSRAKDFRKIVDQMAVIFPFELPLWTNAGIDTRFVGHPSLDVEGLPRNVARDRMGLTRFAPTLALLPGSREKEIRSLLPLMCEAFQALRSEYGAVDARVLLTESVSHELFQWASDVAAKARISVYATSPDRGAAEVLRAFDLAWVCSGTATLETALADVPSVILYPTSRAEELLRSKLLEVKWVGLPNILLERAAIPELLGDVSVAAILRASEPTMEQAFDRLSALLPETGRFVSAKTEGARLRKMLKPVSARMHESVADRVASLVLAR